MDIRMRYIYFLHTASVRLTNPSPSQRTICTALRDWVVYRTYWNDDRSMEAFASEIGVTREEFGAFTMYWAGERFMTMRKRLRIHDAKQLFITRPEMSIAQVARTVGYQDKSDFRKAFTEETGYPPRLWRECGGNILKCWISKTRGADGSRCPSRRKSARWGRRRRCWDEGTTPAPWA